LYYASKVVSGPPTVTYGSSRAEHTLYTSRAHTRADSPRWPSRHSMVSGLTVGRRDNGRGVGTTDCVRVVGTYIVGSTTGSDPRASQFAALATPPGPGAAIRPRRPRVQTRPRLLWAQGCVMAADQSTSEPPQRCPRARLGGRPRPPGDRRTPPRTTAFRASAARRGAACAPHAMRTWLPHGSHRHSSIAEAK